MRSTPSKDDRVLVVGAGAAGLSVASRLLSRGFRRVVVLEAGDRVGGKCCSVQVGERWYEMGAIAFPGRNSVFRALAEEQGLRPSSTSSYSYTTQRGSRAVPEGLSLGLPWQALRLGSSALRLQRPGYLGVPASLGVPMGRWLEERRLSSVGKTFQPIVTGLGYGFFQDIAAAYVLKHVSLFRPRVYQLFDGGSQRVWERVARALDVRLGHAVERIERSADGKVHAHTAQGRFEGDWLFVATPPRQTRAFLDASEDDGRLLDRFRCFSYHTMLCDVEGLPAAHFGFFTDTYARLEPGCPVAYARRDSRAKTMTLYSYLNADAPMAYDAIAAANAAYLRTLGARLGTVHRQHTWEYFPHVEGSDIASGFFDKLDARQGRDRTFYVGEALAYPTVRHVVDHAYAMVDRFF